MNSNNNSRADLFKSGELIDLSKHSAFAKFQAPIAATKAVSQIISQYPNTDIRWEEIAENALIAANKNPDDTVVYFSVLLPSHKSREHDYAAFKMTISPDEYLKPTITISRLNEKQLTG